MAIYNGTSGNDKFLSLSRQADQIFGLEGNDSLNGAIGSDLIDGGAGIDTLIGGAGDDHLKGDADNDTLTGDDGNDRLDGGDGIDRLVGGLGNDIYVIDRTEDVVVEAAKGGTDTIIASFDFDMAAEKVANIEVLRITGAATKAYGDGAANTIYGNASANYIDGRAGADTMVGGAGDDTYVVDNAKDVVTEKASDVGIDLIRSSVSYVLGAGLEKLVLRGSQAINGTGNSAANLIVGNAASNILNGGAGADQLIGGRGNDTYEIDSVDDEVFEMHGEGNDTIRTSVNIDLVVHGNGGAAGVENVVMTGKGNLTAIGNQLNNLLIGNVGANRFEGRGGNDTMIGGLGNDTYVFVDAGDVITEKAKEGTDTVEAWTSYRLGADLENIKLKGDKNINATGNGLNNVIFGNLFSNVLDGSTGADKLVGGDGNDTYVIDNVKDVIDESGYLADVDTVRSSVSFSFASHELLEHLVLTGKAASGTGNLRDNLITGNSVANRLSGGGGKDTLSGGDGNDILSGGDGDDILNGGAGADTMIGGNGIDTYHVDNVLDVVTETGATPNEQDYVRSTISYSLEKLGQVEQLTLLESSKALNATGNALGNHLFGNSRDNVLDGRAGADFMRGESGNDIYIVDDSLGDVVDEAVDGGIDTVRSSVSFTLSANVENLVLTGQGGTTGIGNDLGNYIVGNDGSNTLNGNEGDDTLNGGSGDDILVGGAGSDQFVFSAGSGRDVINDFVASADKIDVRGLFSTWDELLASATTVTDNVVIQITQNDSLTIRGFTKDNLFQADFLF